MNEKIKETFDLIHADEKTKNMTKAYLMKKTSRKPFAYSLPYKKMLAAMVCFVVAFLGVQEYQAYYTPVALISVDVNPSFEIEINRFDKVISVSGYNEDGEVLVQQLNLKHLNYNDALDEIFVNKQIQNYLASDEMLSLTLIDADEKSEEKILTSLNQHASKHQNVSCHQGDKNNVEKAHQAGLSFGKYQAYLELVEKIPEVSIEDIKEMDMKEIRQMIDDCDNQNTHHGSGHHYQKGS